MNDESLDDVLFMYTFFLISRFFLNFIYFPYFYFFYEEKNKFGMLLLYAYVTLPHVHELARLICIRICFSQSTSCQFCLFHGIAKLLLPLRLTRSTKRVCCCSLVVWIQIVTISCILVWVFVCWQTISDKDNSFGPFGYIDAVCSPIIPWNCCYPRLIRLHAFTPNFHQYHASCLPF